MTNVLPILTTCIVHIFMTLIIIQSLTAKIRGYLKTFSGQLLFIWKYEIKIVLTRKWYMHNERILLNGGGKYLVIKYSFHQLNIIWMNKVNKQMVNIPRCFRKQFVIFFDKLTSWKPNTLETEYKGKLVFNNLTKFNKIIF